MRTSILMKSFLQYFTLLLISFFYCPLPLKSQDIATIRHYLKAFKPGSISHKSKYLDPALKLLNEYPHEDKIRGPIQELYHDALEKQQSYYHHQDQLDKFLESAMQLKQKIEQLPQPNAKDSTRMRRVSFALMVYYIDQKNSEKYHYYDKIRLAWDPEKRTANPSLAYDFLLKEKYAKAIKHGQLAIDKFSKSGNIKMVVAMYKVMTRAAIGQGNLIQAWGFLHKAKIFLNNPKDDDLRDWLSDLLLLESNILLAEKKFSLAKKKANKALDVIKVRLDTSLVYTPELSQYYVALGDIDYLNQQSESALKNYQKGIIYLLPNFKQAAISANPSIEPFAKNAELLEILLKKINASYKVAAHKNTCRQTIEKAIKLNALVRSNYISNEDEYFLIEQGYDIYAKAITLDLEAQDTLSAFHASDQSKGITLADQLEAKQIDYDSASYDAITSRISLIKELILMKQQRSGSVNQTNQDTLDVEITKLKFELNGLQDSLKNTPGVQEILASMKAPSLEAIRANLYEGQAIIEFFQTEKEFIAFFIEKNNPAIKVARIPLNDTLKNSISQLKRSVISRAIAPYINRAYPIYKQLFFDPFFKDLDKLPESLIIIPHGILNNLPYAALITEEVNEIYYKDFTEHPYFFKQTAISIWPSASIATNIQYKKTKDKYTTAFAAYAPSFNPKGNFDALKNKDEIAEILDILDFHPDDIDVNVVLDHQASRQHFINNSEDVRILHLATHGVVVSPQDSYIAFSDLRAAPFKLTITDLYLQDIKAALVVLSACQTGAGESVKGEGVLSTARAFLYAGAKSVLTASWKIKQDATKQFMTYYYEALKHGKRKDIALQEAQLKYIEYAGSRDDEGKFDPHPVDWAAFSIIGNTVPIYPEQTDTSNGMYWLMLFALLGLSFLMISRYRRTRKNKH